jgi:hypothetical protein
MAFAEWHNFSMDKRLRVLPGLWILGWVLERLVSQGTWYWHYAEIFVYLGMVWIAWRHTERRILPMLLVCLILLGKDLFTINEPGILVYDQWIFAAFLVSIAYFSGGDLWGMTLALSGGTLLSLGFSIFLFSGIVNYYDLPEPFLWHFNAAVLAGFAILKQVLNLMKQSLRRKSI